MQKTGLDRTVRRRAISCVVALFVLFLIPPESGEEEQPAVPGAVSFHKLATYDQPARVAYLAPRRKRQHVPRAEEVPEDYQNFAQGAGESDHPQSQA